MVKKIIIGILLLLSGFMIGGLFYRFYETRLPEVVVMTDRSALKNMPVFAAPSFPDIVNSISPVVVNISTVKMSRPAPAYSDDPFMDFFNDFFSPHNEFEGGGAPAEQSLGSGLIVSEDGYIITNYHVVSNAEKIDVTLYDNRVFSARIIGTDPKTDLAILKIEAAQLPTIPWADSDHLRVGEFVFAVGNPFGLKHTVTLGIVSAVGRADVGIADYEDFIQTDAAINPGNSGGPLIDTDGYLVGINTAIFSKSGGYQGIGFAVPSNMARMIMKQLISEGRVIRGWLGVTIQDIVPGLGSRFGHNSSDGALVGEVIAGSPAKRAGIKRGDIILEFAGKTVMTSSMLRNMAATSKPGTKVPLKLLRDRRHLRLIMTVGELPPEVLAQVKDEPPGRPFQEQGISYGMSVITLTDDIARQLNVEGETAGVVVVGVKEGSSAQMAGIQRGDVILEIEGNAVQDIDSYHSTINLLQPGDAVLMYLNRGGRKFYLSMPVL